MGISDYYIVMQKKHDLMKIKDKNDYKFAFRIWCALYFKTNVWKIKRKMVLERCKGICEKCGKKKVVDIHHLNYDSLGQERLESLIGLCRKCHKKEHNID